VALLLLTPLLPLLLLLKLRCNAEKWVISKGWLVDLSLSTC
jgi:hypothetical protein